MNRRNFLKLIGVAPVIPGVLMAKGSSVVADKGALPNFAVFSDAWYNHPEPDYEFREINGLKGTKGYEAQRRS